MIRLLICEDSAEARSLLRTLLADHPEIEIVGEAADGQDALARTIELSPDVVLMDVMMPVLDGVSATRRIRELRPDVRIVAFTGSDDNELVRELEPDLVVLDVMMPGRSGLDVLAEMRSDPALAEIPVIVITAWDHVQPDVLAAGADRFFLKPFEAEDLKAAVAELLEAS